jgi:hypothetical protein
MGRACNTHGKMKTAYIILVRKPEVKRPLTTGSRKWEVNVIKELK